MPNLGNCGEVILRFKSRFCNEAELDLKIDYPARKHGLNKVIYSMLMVLYGIFRSRGRWVGLGIRGFHRSGGGGLPLSRFQAAGCFVVFDQPGGGVRGRFRFFLSSGRWIRRGSGVDVDAGGEVFLEEGAGDFAGFGEGGAGYEGLGGMGFGWAWAWRWLRGYCSGFFGGRKRLTQRREEDAVDQIGEKRSDGERVVEKLKVGRFVALDRHERRTLCQRAQEG